MKIIKLHSFFLYIYLLEEKKKKKNKELKKLKNILNTILNSSSYHLCLHASLYQLKLKGFMKI